VDLVSFVVKNPKWKAKCFMDINKQIEIFAAGCVDVISEEDLRGKLKQAQDNKKPLRIKYGADPSTSDIHLGHTVPLRKLRQLQDIGHHVDFLIGDFTAMIGDPSGRSETRNMISAEQVKENALTYQEQVFRILDKEKTTVHYNSTWLDKLTPQEFLILTSKYTVARILERDDFKKRFETKEPITILEFLYPLLQGYDSVALKSDVELGGTDQKFNLLVGRALQRDYGCASQVVLTLPLLEGTDGVQKMSKTYGNSINIKDTSTEMFGKIMSLPDTLILKYYVYLTSRSNDELNNLEALLKKKETNPRDIKVALAKDIVAFYCSPDEAERAEEEFNRIFRDKGVPDDIVTHEVDVPSIGIVNLLAQYSMAKSKSEARRLIKQGGVKINNEKCTDVDAVIEIKDELLIQCGKRVFAKFKPKA